MPRCFGLALLAVLCGGCADPPPVTEIYLAVGSNLDPEQMKLVTLDIERPPEPPHEGLVAYLDPRHESSVELPVSWGLWARDPHPQPFEVHVRGYERGAPSVEDPLVEQRARLRFVPRDIRQICLFLHGGCGGVSCPRGTTCVWTETPECVPVCTYELPPRDPDSECPGTARLRQLSDRSGPCPAELDDDGTGE